MIWKQRSKQKKVCILHPLHQMRLVTVVVLLVLLALALAAVYPVAVFASSFAVIAHVEARVHLGQRVHAQDLVDLAERKQAECKLQDNRNHRAGLQKMNKRSTIVNYSLMAPLLNNFVQLKVNCELSSAWCGGFSFT